MPAPLPSAVELVSGDQARGGGRAGAGGGPFVTAADFWSVDRPVEGISGDSDRCTTAVLVAVQVIMSPQSGMPHASHGSGASSALSWPTASGDAQAGRSSDPWCKQAAGAAKGVK